MEDHPLSILEGAALHEKLRLMEELLAVKDRELAAKDETLALLRQKAARLERAAPGGAVPDPRESFYFVAAEDDAWAGQGGRGIRTPTRQPQARAEPPKTLWAKFYHWFREA